MIVFLGGVLIGAMIGVLVMGLLTSGKEADHHERQEG